VRLNENLARERRGKPSVTDSDELRNLPSLLPSLQLLKGESSLEPPPIVPESISIRLRFALSDPAEAKPRSGDLSRRMFAAKGVFPAACCSAGRCEGDERAFWKRGLIPRLI